ncbi:MAG TPA: RNA polymerase subunit sigma, partial [Alcanivorax sp.]|nr:RNA polymerase subunit sigma [Alcanivorax sp.]
MSHATPDPEVLSQAADWFALLRSGDASSEDTRRWRDWLARHPAHRQGWALVERIQQQFEAATGDHPAQADATLSRARDNRLRRRGLLKGLALMLGAGGLGWAGWRADAVQQRLAAWSAPYRTGVGEIRAWTL